MPTSSTIAWNDAPVSIVPDLTTNSGAKWLTAMYNLILSQASVAAMKWQVASWTPTSPTCILVLKRKDGSVGRMVLYAGTAAFAAAQRQSVATAATYIMIGYSPTSTQDTPANFTTAVPLSATDYSLGLCAMNTATSTTDTRMNYFDSQEGIVFASSNVAGTQFQCFYAGELAEDNDGNVYSIVGGGGANYANTTGWDNLPTSSQAFAPYPTIQNDNGYTAGNANAICLINGAWRLMARPYIKASFNNNIGMFNPASGKATYNAILLQGPLDFPEIGMFGKLRQICYGTICTRETKFWDSQTHVEAYGIACHPYTAYSAVWVTNIKV